MGFLDDLQVRVTQAVEKNSDNINNFLADKVGDLFVKVSKPKTGNLSAAQIQAGQRGGDVPGENQAIVVPAAPISMNAKYLIPAIAALAAAAFLFSGSRRKG